MLGSRLLSYVLHVLVQDIILLRRDVVVPIVRPANVYWKSPLCDLLGQKNVCSYANSKIISISLVTLFAHDNCVFDFVSVAT